MRKNKTYEQQNKFYNAYNNYESLGAIFLLWLECGNKTAAKEQMAEEENNILDFYKEEYPDNYEVSEDKDESSWSCSCKDSIMFDELLITESELD